MSTQILIVFIVALLMIIGFASNKFSYPAVAISVIVILEITGVLPAEKAWAGFSSSTAILFASMFVLSAGLAKTSLLSRLSSLIVPEGSSERRAVVGCGLLSIFLTIFSNTSSTMATLIPICYNVAEKAKISPKRLLKPAVDLSSIWAGVIPVGLGLTAYSVSNQMMESLGGNPNFTLMTFVIARLPIVLIISLFIFAVGYRFTPDNYTGIDTLKFSQSNGKGQDKTTLSSGKEKLTFIIFTLTIAAIVISNYIKIINAAACAAIGALLMVFTGILTEKEAMKAINLKVISIYAGTICLAAGINASGATDVISNFMQNILGGITNPYLIAFILVMASTICTQFMNNSSTLNIFRILAAVISVACAFDARSAMVAVEMGATCSVLLPTASATQAMVFAEGGFSVKEYIKAGLPTFILYMILYMLWVPTIYPAL